MLHVYRVDAAAKAETVYLPPYQSRLCETNLTAAADRMRLSSLHPLLWLCDRHSLRVSTYVCLSIAASTSPCLFLSLSLCIYVPVFACLFGHQSVSIFFCLSPSSSLSRLSVCVSVCLSVCLHLTPSLAWAICLSVYLSLRLPVSVCLFSIAVGYIAVPVFACLQSVCLPPYVPPSLALSVCLSICLFVCLCSRVNKSDWRFRGICISL